MLAGGALGALIVLKPSSSSPLRLAELDKVVLSASSDSKSSASSLVMMVEKEWGRRHIGTHPAKAREHFVARGTEQDVNVGDRGQGHGGFESTTIPDKDNLISKVVRVHAVVVIELLTVMLWRQQTKWAHRNIVINVDLEGLMPARIIKNRPTDGANLSRTCSTIETFYLNSRGLRRLYKICQVIRDTGSSATIN